MRCPLHALGLVGCLLVADLVSGTVPVYAAEAGAAEQSGMTKPADPGWPRVVEKDGARVEVYAPQVDQWLDYSRISFRSAIVVSLPGENQPVYGILAGKALTDVDRIERTVQLQNLEFDLRFPEMPQDKATALAARVRELLPQRDTLSVSLDRLLAHMKPEQANVPVVKVDLDPPPIYRSESPAILVIYLGEPQFKPVSKAPETRLMFAANTNWDVLTGPIGSQYYLLNKDSWLVAPHPVKGPWSAAKELPAALSQLPDDPNWQEVRQHIPGEPAKGVPKVFVSTKPAELVVTEGPPAFTPIRGTQLQYASNPPTPLFLHKMENRYYFLAAGRWFRAKGLDGPWSAASGDLPEEFATIPEDSPMGFVLASVPKTVQARDAVLLASVPHKAAIDVNKAKLEVTYNGRPQFAPIQNTTMQYATNTPYQVILAEGNYYCCYQGVWFVSASPDGPWKICASVPQVIYTIPPTSPLYNVTYVKVYEATPETVVVGYTGGYTGQYLAPTGALMFGTGMAIDAALLSSSWWAYGPAYYSYGCAPYYSYTYGEYYRGGAAYYGPYGGAGHWAAYNPATGTYSRGGSAYGPYGRGNAEQAYNPWTGNWAEHAGANSAYQSWGRTAADINGTAIQAGHRTGPEGGAAWANASSGKSVEGARGPGENTVAKTGSGDYYVGHDDAVYRRTDNGQWQKHTSDGWQEFNPAPKENASREQLDQQFAARDRGNMRANDFSQFRDRGFEGREGRGGTFQGAEGARGGAREGGRRR